MDRLVAHWVERSEYDPDTAKAMLDTGRYLYVGYMCQQAIEKLLKAMIAKLNKENLPIHNLNRLAEVAEIANSLSIAEGDFLAELTPYCIEARYGDFKESLSEIIDKKGAETIYRQTREFFKWLYQKIR
jgi:HEPN domain-containing protein